MKVLVTQSFYLVFLLNTATKYLSFYPFSIKYGEGPLFQNGGIHKEVNLADRSVSFTARKEKMNALQHQIKHWR